MTVACDTFARVRPLRWCQRPAILFYRYHDAALDGTPQRGVATRCVAHAAEWERRLIRYGVTYECHPIEAA